MSDFTIGALLQELNDLLLPHLTQRSAELVLNLPDTPLMINGNKDALLGALANLCMNAMDAMNAMHAVEQTLRITIDVSLTRQGDLHMAITDNGCGMESEVLQHLFDPFFTTKMDGTGLGLAVVKSVIESHQGRISVTSTPGNGSCFEIHLPCQQASKTQLSQTRKEAKKND
jgi:two-component system sensor histidine kinase FlrB